MRDFEVVIPCKAFAEGKSRLSGVLSASERGRLCRRLLERTIAVAVAAAGAARVTVVSADTEVLTLSSRLGARPFAETGYGLNAAIHAVNVSLLARAMLEREAAPVLPGDIPGAADARGLVVLPIDLPRISAEMIRDAVARTECVGIAPDEAGTGTNLLVLADKIRQGFPFAFGPRSFQLHAAAARARHAPLTVLRHPDLAFDLDRPDDLMTRYGAMWQLLS